MRRLSPLLLVEIAAYASALVAIGLWPSHVDQNVDIFTFPPIDWLVTHVGLTVHQAYELVEFTANVLLYVPFGLLLARLVPDARWLWIIAAGLITSGVFELAQGAALPGRTASPRDVVANTLGAAIGAGVVLLWRTSVRGSAAAR